MLQFEINLHYRSPFWFRHLRETNFPDGAMKRFLSSAAPNSSGRAEAPSSSSSAEQPATSFRSDEEPATPSQNRYVVEMRKGRLSHTTVMAIRPDDTIGMFHGGMTLLFDTRSEEDVRKEAELLAKACPGCLHELVDDIIPGVSPR